MENVQTFIKDLKKKCKLHGVKLFLYDAKYIEDQGVRLGGYFDDYKKEIHCAFPSKIQAKYVEVLVHESCHMDQWIQDTKYWKIERKNNSLFQIWQLLDGKKVNGLNFHIRNVQNMEAECERMSIEKIKEFDLGLNIPNYIQRANTYLLFYSLLKTTKKWSDYSPYRHKCIWSKMNNDYIADSFELSEELKELLIEKCYFKKHSKLFK
jgi:hypothetical protein